MFLDYINPKVQWRNLQLCIQDKKYHAKYKEIVDELIIDGKLDKLKLSYDSDRNMYLGFNLNPELLIYEDASQESVELSMVRDKLKMYTEFLTKEGIIDYAKMSHERVRNPDYYGYILKIEFDFKYYTDKKYRYSIGFFTSLAVTLLACITVGIILL